MDESIGVTMLCFNQYFCIYSEDLEITTDFIVFSVSGTRNCSEFFVFNLAC